MSRQRNAVTAFGVDLVERAAKTAAQAGLAAIGAEHINLATGGWTTVAYAAAAGFVLSVLTSVASIPVGNTETPSVVNSKQQTQAVIQPVNTAAAASSTDVLAAGNAIYPV